ncbi:hypothetical protein ACU686_35285 [Yinghuangia aomiensis]
MLDLVGLEIDPVIGRSEPDEEVQDLLQASGGLNLGMDFLPGAVGFDPAAWEPDPATAARVLWLDAFTSNVDRTWRNLELLVRQRRAVASSTTAPHCGSTTPGRRRRPPPHGLTTVRLRAALTAAGHLHDADKVLAPQITPELLAEVTALVPDAWLQPGDGEIALGRDSPDALRRVHPTDLLGTIDRPPCGLRPAEVDAA